jgi:hypothetical protein
MPSNINKSVATGNVNLWCMVMKGPCQIHDNFSLKLVPGTRDACRNLQAGF